MTVVKRRFHAGIEVYYKISDFLKQLFLELKGNKNFLKKIGIILTLSCFKKNYWILETKKFLIFVIL
ncbi:hypothetical protein LEP1GSC073_2437 [Leptospira noguchii str. Cascata]|nr:hypothetical protein LEP1GSC073_2437 [Leptospira noguchii str. Cascata]